MNQASFAQQLADTMGRLYSSALTTTSGGNLSIRGEDGTTWITPGGIDKANLTRDDIMRITIEGTLSGMYTPSLETAFHLGVYEARKDIHAVVHAHAPATSAFCLNGTAPDTRLIPQVFLECGPAVMSGYAMPGSDKLRDLVSDRAGAGYNCMLLDHHGTVALGATILQALQRFEALEVLAETQLLALRIGSPRSSGEQLFQLLHAQRLESQGVIPSSSAYSGQRSVLAETARRAFQRRLMTSSLGSLSMRVSRDAFLITPSGKDRRALCPDDIVLVTEHGVEEGKEADLWMFLHREAYRAHDDTHAMMTASPPSAMAYGVTRETYDARTLTEAYVILGDISRLTCEETLVHPRRAAKHLNRNNPVMLISHGGLAAVGTDPLQVLDRIEVAEVSMRAALLAHALGPVLPLEDHHIADMISTFGLHEEK
mgnify:CR=1 FL=1